MCVNLGLCAEPMEKNAKIPTFGFLSIEKKLLKIRFILYNCKNTCKKLLTSLEYVWMDPHTLLSLFQLGLF